MNSYRIRKALKYYLLSRHGNGHGIHSPYIYKLISGDIKNKVPASVVTKVENYRSELLDTKDIIKVRDLGTGSAGKQGDKRRLSGIARNSASRKHYGKLLYRLSKRLDGQPVIELGTSLGISTMYMALASPDSTIYTIEGCPETANRAVSGFKTNNIRNVKQFIGDFDHLLGDVLKESGTPGLVFIDGNHRGEALCRYFDTILPHCDMNTMIVADDIHYSKDMYDAWKTITGKNEVTVSIDFFQLGLLFMNKRLSSQHYVIRY